VKRGSVKRQKIRRWRMILTSLKTPSPKLQG
jgi:hypothetical protein